MFFLKSTNTLQQLQPLQYHYPIASFMSFSKHCFVTTCAPHDRSRGVGFRHGVQWMPRPNRLSQHTKPIRDLEVV